MKQHARIFLAEDNPADVYLLKMALTAALPDCEISVYTNGETALKAISEYDEDQPAPDLVVLDLNLPRRHGREILARIREAPPLAASKIVICSSSPRELVEYDLTGADRYYRKPSDLKEYMQLGREMAEMIAAN
jgi:CheY-like chemotaxis protein